MKRTIESIQPNEVVNCVTEGQARAFLALAFKVGKTWDGGKSYNDDSFFGSFTHKTSYNISDGRYCSTEYYAAEKFTILRASDFLPLNQRLIEQLRKGEIALANTNGTIQELSKILFRAFPRDKWDPDESSPYYYQSGSNPLHFMCSESIKLPTKTIAEFYEPDEEIESGLKFHEKTHETIATLNPDTNLPTVLSILLKNIRVCQKLLGRDLTIDEIEQVFEQYDDYERIYLKNQQ